MSTNLHRKGNTGPNPESRRRAAPSSLDARRWLKCSETAAYLGVSLHHVYRMHRRGQLPSFKLPGLGVRIDRMALDAKINSVKEARARAANATWPV